MMGVLRWRHDLRSEAAAQQQQEQQQQQRSGAERSASHTNIFPKLLSQVRLFSKMRHIGLIMYSLNIYSSITMNNASILDKYFFSEKININLLIWNSKFYALHAFSRYLRWNCATNILDTYFRIVKYKIIKSNAKCDYYLMQDREPGCRIQHNIAITRYV